MKLITIYPYMPSITQKTIRSNLFPLPLPAKDAATKKKKMPPHTRCGGGTPADSQYLCAEVAPRQDKARERRRHFLLLYATGWRPWSVPRSASACGWASRWSAVRTSRMSPSLQPRSVCHRRSTPSSRTAWPWAQPAWTSKVCSLSRIQSNSEARSISVAF
jgi:hypothetical protein